MKRFFSLLGVYLSIFTNALMFTIVFPMASKMIMYFGLVKNRSETGYWVGFLGGSIMFGRFLSAPAWGWLCDHWGRKPTMLIGIVTTSVLAVLFGISNEFYWALAFRFLQGLLSPITVVSRTIISELFSGSDQASAMSWFMLVGSIGNIAGNMIGGFFLDTTGAGIWPFSTHPFLLPNSMIALFGLISFILCYIFLDETKPKDSLLDQQDSKPFKSILKEPSVIQVSLLYITVSSNGTAFGELLVLLEWAKLKNGGFELTTGEIGSISAATSIIYMLYVKFLYKHLSDKLGITQLTRKALIVSIPILLLFPLVTLVRYTDYVKYPVLVAAVLVVATFEFMSITSSLIMINNAVDVQYRGKLNGLTLAAGNLARGVSPPLYGSVFAVTATGGHEYPFNFAFSYFILAAFVGLCWRVSCRLDKALDHPKGFKGNYEKTEQELTSIIVVEEREVD